MIGGDRSLRQGKTSPFYRTLEGLSQHFDRIDVLCRESNTTSSAFSEPLFDVVHLHPFKGGVLQLPQWIGKTVASIHERNSVDVLTVHAFPPYVHTLGAVAVSQKLQIPLLVEWHGLPSLLTATNIKEVIGALLIKPIVKGCNQVAAVRSVSSALTAQLTSLGVKPENIHLAHAVYIDPKIFHVDSFTTKRYTAMFCGRIDGNKRLKNILKAFAKVPHAKLLVVGDGLQKSAMQVLAKKLKIAHRIEWTGFVQSPEQVADYLRQSQMLIMPSKYEGGPRVVVEALACGTPVVATPVGIVNDVVTHKYNGFVMNGSTQEIIEGVKYLQSHSECAATAEREAETVAERFERSRLIEQYADLLKQAADKQGIRH